MNKTFKELLLQIASLPARDQKWLTQQLSSDHRQHFIKEQGALLFAHIAKIQEPQPEIYKKEPEFLQELDQQDPLYIALILEQGAFAWQEAFLSSSSQDEQIKQIQADGLKHLKPKSKELLFIHWQQQLDFQSHLELEHG
jgi:hypothetical protein